MNLTSNAAVNASLCNQNTKRVYRRVSEIHFDWSANVFLRSVWPLVSSVPFFCVYSILDARSIGNRLQNVDRKRHKSARHQFDAQYKQHVRSPKFRSVYGPQ